MPTRRASCSCGQLVLTCEGEPLRVSVCHCLACQRRTGSAFGVQARFHGDQVRERTGISTAFTRSGESGGSLTFHFCPECGSTVYYVMNGTNPPYTPDYLAVAVGAFADPSFPAPQISVYESRRHPWATMPDCEHMD
jgi:hypothetical protein